MKKLVFLMILCSIVLAFSTASAVSLDLLPSSQTVVLGESFSVDLVISGLTAGGSPSLSEFDIDLTFGDPTNILTFDSLEFGLFLGDPLDATETSTSVLIVPGSFVGLSEDSLLSAAALDALQPSSFSLATLTFIGSNVGTMTIGGDLFELLDTSGSALIHTFGPVGSASITVSPVPEPSTMLLLGSGLIGLAAYRRRPKN
jgi:hypothetical protein